MKLQVRERMVEPEPSANFTGGQITERDFPIRSGNCERAAVWADVKVGVNGQAHDYLRPGNVPDPPFGLALEAGQVAAVTAEKGDPFDRETAPGEQRNLGIVLDTPDADVGAVGRRGIKLQSRVEFAEVSQLVGFKTPSLSRAQVHKGHRRNRFAPERVALDWRGIHCRNLRCQLQGFEPMS